MEAKQLASAAVVATASSTTSVPLGIDDNEEEDCNGNSASREKQECSPLATFKQKGCRKFIGLGVMLLILALAAVFVGILLLRDIVNGSDKDAPQDVSTNGTGTMDTLFAHQAVNSTIFAKALARTHLWPEIEALMHAGTPVTLLVPVDDAFEEQLDEMYWGDSPEALQWVAHLRQLVRHHIWVGDSDLLMDAQGQRTMWSGETIQTKSHMNHQESRLFYPTLVPDQPAQILDSNVLEGALHGLVVLSIDSVLRPRFLEMDTVDFDYLKNEKNLTYCVGVVEAARAVEVVASIRYVTMFCPTDEAYEALPPEVLSILKNPPLHASPLSLFFDFVATHAISNQVIPRELMKNETRGSYSQVQLNIQVSELDDTVTITNVKGGVSARIIESDILLSNAIVHIVDNLLASPAEYPSV